MDSKPGTRIDNSLGYSVLFSNYGDPGHAIFVAYITLSLGIYFPGIQQSFRTERSGSGTIRRITGTGREENRMKKIPIFKASLHLIL